MGRAMDDAIITAALGGSADTGVAGGTAVALPAGQKRLWRNWNRWFNYC